MKHLFSLLTVLIFLSSPTTFATEGENCVKEPLEEGDVIAIEISDPFDFYKKVAAATLSWTSHVGMAFKEEGKWVVYEQKPVGVSLAKKRLKDGKVPTPLCDFMGRSFEGHHAILRYKKFAKNKARKAEQLAIMKDLARRDMSLRYDFAFDYDDKTTSYCSKFIYDIFQGIGAEIGHKETLADIRAKHPPEQQKELIAFFTQIKFIIATRGKFRKLKTEEGWKQVVVTPATVLNDPDLKLVYRFRDGPNGERMDRKNREKTQTELEEDPVDEDAMPDSLGEIESGE